METAIWLTKVAPQSKSGKRLLDHLANANKDANPELMRLALKLATGAGKTTVMAMLIAWYTINGVRRPHSKISPGVFCGYARHHDQGSPSRVVAETTRIRYYASREFVPARLCWTTQSRKDRHYQLSRLQRRERVDLSKGGRSLLQGRVGPELDTLETEGQMLQRAMPERMGLKNILALNDEAHHCYREKPGDEDGDDGDLKGDDRKEAERNNEAARLWISGLEAVNRQLGLARVIDLSATPFFLRGSGYAEGTLFPWTMSDFSLMDAIESGIVKLPRVPVAENIPGGDMPMFRNLWENIRKDMPRKGRGKAQNLDPLALPTRLQTALQALYGHYEKTFGCGQHGSLCPRASSSSATTRRHRSRSTTSSPGFIGRTTTARARWRTAASPSSAISTSMATRARAPTPCSSTASNLESGDALDDDFRGMAADEIDRFRREIVERTGDRRAAETLTDQELLREVMNTVGRPGRLGRPSAAWSPWPCSPRAGTPTP